MSIIQRFHYIHITSHLIDHRDKGYREQKTSSSFFSLEEVAEDAAAEWVGGAIEVSMAALSLSRGRQSGSWKKRN